MKTIDNFLQEIDVTRALIKTYKKKDKIKKAVKAADKLIHDKNIDVQEASIKRVTFELSKRKSKTLEIVKKIKNMLQRNPDPHQAVQLHNALRKAEERVVDLDRKMKLASVLV